MRYVTVTVASTVSRGRLWQKGGPLGWHAGGIGPRPMDIPAQITFHHMSSSPTLEAEAESWIRELETYHHHIIRCRVVFEAPPHHGHKGVRVGVELGVPGHHLSVHRTSEDPAQENVVGALREAFVAMRRELEDHERLARGDVKTHVAPPQGRVTYLDPAGDFGRLETADGRDVYFHRNSVLGGLDKLVVGDEVRFHEENGAKGPQASTVERVGRQGRHVLEKPERKGYEDNKPL